MEGRYAHGSDSDRDNFRTMGGNAMTRIESTEHKDGRWGFALYAPDGDDKADAISTRSYGTEDEAISAAEVVTAGSMDADAERLAGTKLSSFLSGVGVGALIVSVVAAIVWVVGECAW